MSTVPKASRRGGRPKSGSKAPEPSSRSAPDISWIRTLAAPYLRGFLPRTVARGALRGYRFLAPYRRAAGQSAGFFVGYVTKPGGYEFLKAAPPECIVFAFIRSPDSALHKTLVAPEDSVLRKTAEYIGWLTHRPPRFSFFDDREVVLVRHFSMRAWPAAKHQHYSRNFFIETLAWLVRSGLVEKLRGGKTQIEGAN